MDLEGQRVVSCRAGCTKSRIWEDRIKRFVRSPGSQAVEEAKEGQRDTKKENETEKSTERSPGGGIGWQEGKSPFLSSEKHLLFLEDTP